MGKAYVVSPAADLWTSASLSATNEDADYPDSNSQDYDPANPFKATTTASTITATHSSSARKLIALINTSNLVGATITAGGVSVTPAARTADGQCVNVFKVLDLGAGTSTALAISGASVNVQIGRVVLASAIIELNWVWGGAGAVGEDSEWPTNEIPTHGGSVLLYEKGYRIRRASGRLMRESDRATWLALAQAAKGRVIPFLFIPDIDVNDCWYVRLAESSVRALKRMRNVTDVSIELEEVSSGLPL
jgi:hypothetical protein